MSVSTLPQELVDDIIDEFSSNADLPALARLALVSRAWTPRSRSHQFRHVNLYDDDFHTEQEATYRVLENSAAIRGSIQSIRIASGSRGRARASVWSRPGCRLEIGAHTLLRLLRAMPRLKTIDMKECAVVPPADGDAASMLSYCLPRGSSLKALWYEPSFMGSPKFDAFYTLLFFRHVAIHELCIRGCLQDPRLVHGGAELEEKALREMQSRLALQPSPEDYELLQPCHIDVLDVEKRSYSWFSEIAEWLLASSAADMLSVTVSRSWDSPELRQFFERVGPRLTRLRLYLSVFQGSPGAHAYHPLLKPCISLREIVITLPASVISGAISRIYWSGLPAIPPSVDQVRLQLALPVAGSVQTAMQTWDSVMHWTELEDVLRKASELRMVVFEAFADSGRGIHEETREIVQRKLPEMHRAGMLCFA
ncbi:hypothetical protein PsYK624_077370 [Phanerochaete sordida]|uniref:F-box domain-containing protein n=1 Tax=Phanerochaete sordida TaxID=48140 RepID=A0A9P3LF21_9APHY|nr:hypothetical protein PsYK624_077370 [Phanerochaete sordida]